MQGFNYILLRKPYRKTISVEVTPKNKIVVKASKSYPDKLINQFIIRKSRWIQKQLDFNKKIRKPPLMRKYISGEEYLYLGNYYQLLLIEGKFNIRLDNKYLKFSGSKKYLTRKKYIQNKLKVWYKEQAYKKILERVSFYEKVLGVYVSDLRIKSFNRSWGNCSSKKQVSFSPYLVMAPITVIDYVVAHELTHIIISNHSAKFWKFLEKIIPDYKQRKQWLVVHENQFCI
ncbi:MAG: M48 family metallopeptidase [Candidatus Omnitrophica bacterium]|nr:M48 family metallopeptidase [Candidatus Omnitrophota bacterium]MCF7878477.1 M48 family metallopeptidase [Candidatus Omnitrophota bacterium]MCF7893276.1 M48 family metallopeptidase [Candidatus Omnitrophota bacterium]